MWKGNREIVHPVLVLWPMQTESASWLWNCLGISFHTLKDLDRVFCRLLKKVCCRVYLGLLEYCLDALNHNIKVAFVLKSNHGSISCGVVKIMLDSMFSPVGKFAIGLQCLSCCLGKKLDQNKAKWSQTLQRWCLLFLKPAKSGANAGLKGKQAAPA